MPEDETWRIEFLKIWCVESGIMEESGGQNVLNQVHPRVTACFTLDAPTHKNFSLWAPNQTFDLSEINAHLLCRNPRQAFRVSPQDGDSCLIMYLVVSRDERHAERKSNWKEKRFHLLHDPERWDVNRIHCHPAHHLVCRGNRVAVAGSGAQC